MRRSHRPASLARSACLLQRGAPSSDAMADRRDLDFTYSLTDRIFRDSMGELADFSRAKYDGDFSMSLEEAQRRKHQHVAEQLGIGPGKRILDLGCGWGALLNFIRNRGGTGIGVTLSAAQAAACRRHGLDVQLLDARRVSRESFGRFDAAAGLGAFAHFCSPDDYGAGRPANVYRELSARVASGRPGRPAGERPRSTLPSPVGRAVLTGTTLPSTSARPTPTTRQPGAPTPARRGPAGSPRAAPSGERPIDAAPRPVECLASTRSA